MKKVNLIQKVKEFKLSDLKNGRIYLSTSYPHAGELVTSEANYGHTISGYGAKIPSNKMIYFEGRLRRIYVTCYSNAGSSWFIYKGEQIHVS